MSDFSEIIEQFKILSKDKSIPIITLDEELMSKLYNKKHIKNGEKVKFQSEFVISASY